MHCMGRVEHTELLCMVSRKDGSSVDAMGLARLIKNKAKLTGTRTSSVATHGVLASCPQRLTHNRESVIACSTNQSYSWACEYATLIS